MQFTIEEFFLIFCTYRKRLQLFIFGEFAELTKQQFTSLRPGQTFVCCGTEFIIKNNGVSKHG